MFRKRRERKSEERWDLYKKRMKEIAEGLELSDWFQELMISTILEEEQRQPLSSLAHWMDNWEKEGQLPKDFADENMLLDVYQSHPDWVADTIQFHMDIRKSDGETFESLIDQIGYPVTDMSLEAQQAYFALWGEIMNVVAQTVDFD